MTKWFGPSGDCGCCGPDCTCATYKSWVPLVGGVPNYNCQCLDADAVDGEPISSVTVTLGGSGTYNPPPVSGSCSTPSGGCGDWTGTFAVPCGETTFMKVYYLCDTFGTTNSGATVSIRVWAAQWVQFSFKAQNTDLTNSSSALSAQKSLNVKLYSGFLVQTTSFGGSFPPNIWAAYEAIWDIADSPTSPAYFSAVLSWAGPRVYSESQYADNTRHYTYVFRESDCVVPDCQDPVYLHDCTSTMTLYASPTISGGTVYGCIPDSVTITL